MKKKEKLILGIIALIAIIAIGVMKKPSDTKVNSDKGTQTAKVAIVHGDQVVQEFDPNVDAIYDIQGDYGKLRVEVKDGKWHVMDDVECPNLICNKMGWVGVDDVMPITCLPNNIIIVVEESQ